MDSVNKKAVRAAQDDSYMNEFIAENKTFILGCAGKQAGRYISESDDEFSIAMYAFFTAITKYNTDQGDFLPFAGLVIKRRLTDYYRTQQPVAHFVAVQQPGYQTDYRDKAVAEQKSQIRGKTK